jgi:hypothetical protein
MPWIKIPVTDISIRFKDIKPPNEVLLDVSMGRGGGEWKSQEFLVKIGESFIIPFVEQGTEGIGKAMTWPLENIGG